jgi:hypothetical protein
MGFEHHIIAVILAFLTLVRGVRECLSTGCVFAGSGAW